MTGEDNISISRPAENLVGNSHQAFLPSRQLSPTSISKALADYRVLLAEQILLLRNTLPFYLFLQTVVPLAFVFALGHYGGTRPSDSQLLRLISGTITFNLAYLGLMSIASRLSFMRQEGTLLYYCSLPISKASFVAALLSARMVILFPSIVVPIIGGALLYGLNIYLDFWIVVVLGLGILSLTLAGTALGVLIKNHEMVMVLTNALVFIMALASPNFLPVSALPLPLQLLGWILPTTYISDALSRCLAGIYDQLFYLDLLALVIMGSLALLVTINFLSWKAD